MNTPIDDIEQSAYLSGYAASERRYSVDGIRRLTYYTALIAGLVGYVLGALVSRL